MNKLDKNKIIIISLIAVVVLVSSVLLFIYISKLGSIKLYSTEVKQGSITEKINLTGQVKASQGVDLAFESSGKIIANSVKVGDKIYTGQALLSIDSSLLQSQLKQAEAQLDILNINTVQDKANAGLKTAYASGLGLVQKSVTVAKNSLIVMTDIQYNHFMEQTNENLILQNTKANAVYFLLGQADAGGWTSKSISALNGGAFGLAQRAVENSTNENIDTALSETLSALETVRFLINAIPINSSLTATERANIVTEKTNISTEIINISNSIQSISSQKVNNDATVTTTNAQIESAKANIETIKTQISKTTLRALFNGKVDKNDTIVGAIASPGAPVITISNDNLEIQTNIPESSVASVKIGSSANVTLDAYGASEIFPATVVSIDSAPSLENGISVYKARLKFTNNDEKIKSGMTANVTIMPETHSDVLIIPKSAVMQKDGKYFVILDNGTNKKETREVTIGLKDDKNVEIISGLNLGEKIFSY